MKNILILSLLLTMISMTAVKKEKIIFFGDSITEAGVNKGGYIDRIQTFINQRSIQEKYELAGAGIGGNKVYDLYLRMEDDVLAKDPQTVVIYVGINDVWHKTSHGTGTDLDKYEKFYVAIIKKLQAKNIKVAVCTPSVIGEKKNNANPQDADLERYSEVIRDLATTYSCQLIELRAVFGKYEQENNTEDRESGILTTDRVHLNENGNQLVADEMIRVLGIQ